MKVRSRRQMNSSSVRSNGGFSLLELIISIAILAIIIGPLMSAFVVSSQSVSKSKRLADQNAAAQMVYEKIQAVPGDYLYSWIRGDDKKNNKLDLTVSTPGAIMYAYDNNILDYFGADRNSNLIDDSEIINNSWDVANKKDNHGDIIHLSLPDIYQNGALKYSAAVTLQAGLGNSTDESKNGNISNLVDGSVIQNMNETKLTQPMTFDNIFIQQTDKSADPDKLVESYINPDTDNVLNRKRTIYVHFSTSKTTDTAGNTTTYVKPVVCYCYDITYNRTETKDGGSTVNKIRLYSVPTYNSDKNTITVTTKKTVNGTDAGLDNGEKAGFIDESFPAIRYIYTDNGKVRKDPIDFYVCFQPYYEGNSSQKENIFIDNIDNVEGDIYLVKQNGDDAKPYGGTVRLMENHRDNKDFNLLVHTNMGLKTDMETDLGSGRFYFRKFYDVDSTKLTSFYNRGSTSTEPDERWYLDGSNDESFTSLVNKKAEERVYSVTIRIYDSLQLDTGNGKIYSWKDGYYISGGAEIPPRYTLTGIKRG